MAKTIARITGTALVPGISRNARYYSPELVRKTVARAQRRITEGVAPLTMLTHHPDPDDPKRKDVSRIVGRVTRITMADDGSARYEAALADTPYGRTVAALVNTSDGDPFLRGVSIRGAWEGPVRQKMENGQLVEYADDLDLDGLDFTSTPGVFGASIDSAVPENLPNESVNGRTLIYESVQEARVTITEDAVESVEEAGAPALKSGKPAAAPTPGASDYADPGYQDDKAKRYPLDTIAHARAAYSYVSMPKNAAMYTAAQLKRVKARIVKALRKFGVKVDAKESWIVTPAVAVTEAVTEAMSDIWPDQPGSFCVDICNGMVDIRVASYRVDPADLEVVARAAMEGACLALAAMDPDMDGDIDAPTGSDDDDTMESGPDPAHPAVETAQPADLPDLTSVTDTVADAPNEKEPGMAEQPTTAAAEVPPATTPPTETPTATPSEPTLTLGQVKDLFASFAQAVTPVAQMAAPQLVGAGAPAESAPAPAAVTETAQTPPAAAPAPVTETADQRDQRIAEAAVRSYVATQAEAGNVGRKGLTVNTAAGVRESADGSVLPDGVPDKPFHELDPQEWKRVRNQVGAEVAGIQLP